MTQKIPLKNINDENQLAATDLYLKRKQIYTRTIKGYFQRVRLLVAWILTSMFFITPWLSWGDRQAVLFDLPSRQFHIFNITFWPQDFSLLAWLLIIAAFGLFFITTWLGRIWCGYSCPQTIWTNVFMWCEQVTEGNRSARIKLDKRPWNTNKILRKGAKHILWISFSIATSVAFLGYFSPIRELIPNIFSFNLGPWETFWILFFIISTYGSAGWLREQVCMYMCPYARFQGAMFDKDTLMVSYNSNLGESRGARKRGVDYKNSGLGNCIDCHLCVQVCPVGIDIRDGLQPECINCALCIDACNSIMDKMNYPQGLISYSTENVLEGEKGNLLRPKLVGYGAVLFLMIVLFSYHIAERVPLELDIIRDRTQMYRITDHNMVENTYTLKIMNMSQQPRTYNVSASGLEQLKFKGKDEINVAPGEIRTLPVLLEINPNYLKQNNSIIYFTIFTPDQSIKVIEESRFLGPFRR